MFASFIILTLAVVWLSSLLSTVALCCLPILTVKKKMNGWVLGGDRATAVRPRRQDTQLAKASTVRARGKGSQQGSSQQRPASDNILINTAKLALSTAKQVRQLTCAVMRTLSIPTASPLGPKFQAIAARDLPWREDQLLYTWGLLITTLCEAPDSGTVSDALACLRAHAISCHSPDALRPYVLACDVRTTFNGDTVNIKFATTSELHVVEVALTRQLITVGGHILYGAAPRGPLERAVAAGLTSRTPHVTDDAGLH